MQASENRPTYWKTRREIERAYFAHRCMTLNRMNLAVMMLLSMCLLSMILYLCFTSVSLHELAGNIWTSLAEHFFSSPATESETAGRIIGNAEFYLSLLV